MSHSRNPRVLVLWADAHSSNLGVQALAAGTKYLVSAIAKSAEVSHLSYGPARSKNIKLTARNLSLAMLGMNKELTAFLATFDLVVDTGAGDSFSDIYGMRRLSEMSALRALIQRLEIPLVLGPQTIGPFDTVLGRLVAKKSVGTQAVVIARDYSSRDSAETLLKRTVPLASDVVFLLPAEHSGKRSGVSLNVSGLLWQKNSHVDYKFYREQVIEFAESAIGSGKKLTLVSHVIDPSHPDNDIDSVDECSRILGKKAEIFHPEDLADIRSHLASAEIVVAARMHAVLNSLSQGVPAVAWSYSRKFAPLLSDLGWQHNFDLRERRSSISADTLKLVISSRTLDREAEGVRRNAYARMTSVIEYLKGIADKQ